MVASSSCGRFVTNHSCFLLFQDEVEDNTSSMDILFKRILLNTALGAFFEENLTPPEGVLGSSIKNETEKEMKYASAEKEIK